MAETVFSALTKKLQEEIDSHSDHITRGRAKDYSDYCGMCGYINGVRRAMVEIETLEKAYIEGDDDE